MKTRVKMKHDDKQYKEWVKNEEGYIESCIYHQDVGPLLFVVIGSRIILCKNYDVEVII